MSERNDDSEYVEQYERMIGAIGAHLKSEETKRFLFVSVSDDGVPFSCGMAGVDGNAVESEAEMLSEYMLRMADREGIDPETVMRTVVDEMNKGSIGFKDE